MTFTKRFEFDSEGNSLSVLSNGFVPIKEGSSIIFNHSSFAINDSIGLSSIEYNARILRDSNTIVSDNWQSRILYNNLGGEVIHYNTDCALYDNNANPSIGWHNRYMYDHTGAIKLIWDDGTGNIIFKNIPTSNAGLSSGALYTTAGALMLVP